MRTRLRFMVWLPVLLLLLVAAPPGEANEDFPIRALILRQDHVGLRRIYDGVRKGLEQAQLPRIRIEPVPEGKTLREVVDGLVENPPPLLFVIGRGAAHVMRGRLADVPRVYVDAAWFVGRETFPPEPDPEAPAAVVRAAMSAARLGEVLYDLYPGRSPLHDALVVRPSTAPRAPDREPLHILEDRVLGAAYLEVGGAEPNTRPGARPLLHLHFGPGRSESTLETLLEIARGEKMPLVSDDLGHWGSGAAIVVGPDHRLLGRVAAEMGRRLLEAPDGEVEHRLVRGFQVRVDLDEARAQGLEPPLSFIARADALRADRRRAPADGGR